MGGRSTATRAGKLRRSGIRVSAGPWTACAQKAATREGQLILAFGRTAGGAVTRSRLRRISREVLGGRRGKPREVDMLLLARRDMSRQSRKSVRASLDEVSKRIAAALTRQSVGGAPQGQGPRGTPNHDA